MNADSVIQKQTKVASVQSKLSSFLTLLYFCFAETVKTSMITYSLNNLPSTTFLIKFLPITLLKLTKREES